MGIKTEIEFDDNKKALNISNNKSFLIRKDVYLCLVLQTRKGEEIHMINYNSTSSYKRAKKWLRLYKRKFLFEMYKSWGLITTVKFLLD
jgi:hypothetical protein